MAKDDVEQESFNTPLNDEEQKQYEDWRSKLPSDRQSDNEYDLQGFWKANKDTDPGSNLHFTDVYKKPNHPTFSVNSKYSTGDHVGGMWMKNASGSWVFAPSAWNKKNMSRAQLKEYFDKYEPGNMVYYPGDDKKVDKAKTADTDSPIFSEGAKNKLKAFKDYTEIIKENNNVASNNSTK